MTARYVVRRLLQGVGVLWAAYTIAFVVLYLLPSDPVRIMLSGSGAEFVDPNSADLAALEREYGFDKPFYLQYLHAVGRALRGDFGQSIQRGESVSTLLAGALGQTAKLAGTAFAIALVIGLAGSLFAAFVRNRAVRQALLAAPSVAVSVPTFWSGLLLTQVFAFSLGWVNVFDDGSGGALLLAAVTLAVPTSAYITQVLSKSLLATLGEPYVEVVRSRGASEARVVLLSGLRNASLPLFTMVGMIVGNMLAGSVVVETVFARSGIGSVTFEAVTAQDIPVVMGVVVFAAATFVVISLVVDLVYPILDPRVTVYSARRRPRADLAPTEAVAP
ncbi:ABC transporter permease [Dactylosporangium fulvum]|uniref:ABC transporter permease n=1 Tax=Dactylosporangium fulvum TaxID=53359 RepID=A0ABY5VMR2_9ACTN|nr:ABC transporter permease [Dactylosporangium fulvum]UWP78923.1 ABC transporter permease [Dactylosporangium fulvum]